MLSGLFVIFFQFLFDNMLAQKKTTKVITSFPIFVILKSKYEKHRNEKIYHQREVLIFLSGVLLKLRTQVLIKFS